MTVRRKALLAILLAVFITVHIALFMAGGRLRTAGKALIVIDVISAWFVVAAVREARKLEGQKH